MTAIVALSLFIVAGAAPDPPAPRLALPATAALSPERSRAALERPETTLPASATAAIWSVPVGHTLGLMAGMRLSLSIFWPDAYDPLPLSRTAARFGRAYREPPEWRRNRSLLEADGDPWVINVIGHGLFGAEVYGRTRSCGGSALEAFAFTAGASTLWEYGIESWNKQPSGVDLVLTPLLGVAIGEARLQTQRWLRRRPPSTWRRLFEIVIDPLGEGERGLLRTRC